MNGNLKLNEALQMSCVENHGNEREETTYETVDGLVETNWEDMTYWLQFDFIRGEFAAEDDEVLAHCLDAWEESTDPVVIDFLSRMKKQAWMYYYD